MNRTFFTIYSPLQRGPSALDGQPLGLETLRELGYWASSTYLDIPPGGSHAVSMDLSGRLRLGPNGRYRLHLVRQALAAPDDVEVTVDVPAGWHLVPRGGLVVAPDGRHARYRAKVDRDRILDADIERDPHGSLLDRIEAGHG